MTDVTPRVVATDAARDLIATLKAKHGPLMFHQSGGCCDGSAPMCYPLGEFLVGSSDLLLGELQGCPFYIGEDQFAYWEHTQLIIDAIEGRGGAFSLDSAEGRRFLLRSRLYSDAEWARVAPVSRAG
ncbi:acetaldehyde dehydrogenase [Bordetella trematum]|uniref:Uncharacterized protein conserved in bacteria n=1 Tax=Bordetella trematum TaxID=123899 RepID=A0A146B044_9BORD|nr:DUF779 domain-containing protein [Bordetella trematum]AUL46284.1 acetaldehyde dehydrogenase [Bordetella trematum]AZR93054.1 acetaldehyde dehydrogenase [Bordetella trematum]NNH19302.1 DUF779 domain-containing protein [Bordetella trematum]QIM71653.1 DUF779 domain-containing protein [Bordetella trematum]CZZ95362.1 Uncharacterized protein conserved in bacteria [Bordetella trematum]